MDVLGRYYTQDLFSNLLINQFSVITPAKVVDLGVGGGSLIKAASLRWGNAKYYAADIDKCSIAKINKELPFVKIIKANSLEYDINKKLKLKIGSVDIAVCNPPYLKVENKNEYIDLLKKAHLGECKKLNRLTSDIVFLAQNLRLLKNAGEVGIILPDSLVTGHNFEILRQSILSNHRIKGIIELPERIFLKTEAKTHILLIEKGSSTNSKVPLYIAGTDGKCYDQIEISSSLLEQRMDYDFHKWNQKQKVITGYKTLRELGGEIKRGLLTHSAIKLETENYIHTTNLKHLSNLFLKSSSNKQFKNITTQKNDILLARVGRRCVGKVSFVKRGKQIFTDCIYRIRVNEEYVQNVWEALSSKEGQEWLNANSHGVCATVISKKDLLNFPVKI